MAEGIPTIIVQNAELVGLLAVIISSFLYRYLGGEWPLLSKFRRNFLPFLHEVVLEPVGGYAAREQYKREYVGTYQSSLKSLHKRFRNAENFYPNNFAAIKYRVVNGEREYESSSWAYREGGLTGDTQTHFMVYSNGDGTVDIYAHFELSPIPHPIAHYNGSEGVWDINKGVEIAQMKMAQLGFAEVNPEK